MLGGLAPQGEIVLCEKVSLKVSKTGKGRQERQKKMEKKEKQNITKQKKT